jgi:hypothetical protein
MMGSTLGIYRRERKRVVRARGINRIYLSVHALNTFVPPSSHPPTIMFADPPTPDCGGDTFACRLGLDLPNADFNVLCVSRFRF